ncbi:hypothetical protein ACFWBM_09385 [Streptomyces sp. NPDC059980]|uniref:hypothetical protein n=1 Tax=Streptomyces sp. NPDC059980 TaxID=3347022 RepID=UPI0036758D9D
MPMNSLYAALWGLGGSAAAEALQIYLSMRVPGDARSFRAPWSNRKQRKYFWGAVALRLFLGILPPAAITASSHVFSPMHAMVTGMTAPLLISRLAQTQTTAQQGDGAADRQPPRTEARAVASGDGERPPRTPAPRAAADRRVVNGRGTSQRASRVPVHPAEAHLPAPDSAPSREAVGSSAVDQDGDTSAPPALERLGGESPSMSSPDPAYPDRQAAEEHQEDDSESSDSSHRK